MNADDVVAALRRRYGCEGDKAYATVAPEVHCRCGEPLNPPTGFTRYRLRWSHNTDAPDCRWPSPDLDRLARAIEET